MENLRPNQTFKVALRPRPMSRLRRFSIFLPVFNEEPNLRPLHEKLDRSLAQLGRSAEIVYVDDGSTDGSLAVLRELAQKDPRVRVIALRRNYGQTPAMAAGIERRARQGADSHGCGHAE